LLGCLLLLFRMVLLDKHLADLMFADRRRCDGFATGNAVRPTPASHRSSGTPTAPTRREAAEFEAGMSGKPTQTFLAHATRRRQRSGISCYTFPTGKYFTMQLHQRCRKLSLMRRAQHAIADPPLRAILAGSDFPSSKLQIEPDTTPAQSAGSEAQHTLAYVRDNSPHRHALGTSLHHGREQRISVGVYQALASQRLAARLTSVDDLESP
jgi:hypothetical protein